MRQNYFFIVYDSSGGGSDLGKYKILVLWVSLLCKSGLVVNKILLFLF